MYEQFTFTKPAAVLNYWLHAVNNGQLADMLVFVKQIKVMFMALDRGGSFDRRIKSI